MHTKRDICKIIIIRGTSIKLIKLNQVWQISDVGRNRSYLYCHLVDGFDIKIEVNHAKNKTKFN